MLAIECVECGFPLLLLKKGRFIDAGLVVMGGFHLANARLMGLPRLALAFSSTYPAVRALAKGAGGSGVIPKADSLTFPKLTGAGLAVCLTTGLVHQEVDFRNALPVIGEFDTAYATLGSLACVLSRAELVGVLSRVRGALKPGGALSFEYYAKEAYSAQA